MSKILIITDKYLPSPTSNGACVEELVGADIDDEIFVLAIYAQPNQKVDEKNFCCDCQIKQSPKLMRLFSFCQSPDIVKKITDNAKKIIDANNIDTVICVYRPVESLVAGIKLKRLYKKKIKVVSCFFDNFQETIFTNKYKLKILHFNEARLLRKLHKSFDGLLLLKYYKETFKKILGTEEKLHYIGIPNLVCPNNHQKTRDNDKKILVYAGSFYDKVRNPDKPLEYLYALCKGFTNLEMHFYSWGCEDVVKKWQLELGDKLILHGKVDAQIASAAINDADILLNIGNDLPAQVPGKLFEYFSTGKPVINWCFRDDDPAMQEYKKYNNILLINSVDRSIKEDIKFLNSAEVLDFKEIREKFKEFTPEYLIDTVNNIS